MGNADSIMNFQFPYGYYSRGSIVGVWGLGFGVWGFVFGNC